MLPVLPVVSPWWFPLGDAHGQRPVLFLPPSGAEPSVAQPLVAHAGGLRFGVLTLPGRGRRHDEPAPTDLADLVRAVADGVVALGGPAPVVVGHSFGALLAYGVVGELEDRGHDVARLVAVTGSSPRSWSEELARDRSERPGESRADFARRRAERILRLGGAPAEVLAHPELGGRARRLVEVDAGLSHEGFALRTLRTPVTSIVARDDPLLTPEACAGWAEVSTTEHLRVEVPGGHFFYREQPARLMTGLRMDVLALDGQYDVLG